MRIVGDSELVARWMCPKLDMEFEELGPYYAFGFSDGDVLKVGLLYRNYREGVDIEIAYVLADGFKGMSRTIMEHAFGYPFKQLGVPRVTSVVSGRNRPALKLTPRYGFKYEGKMRKAMNGVDDAWIFGMLREECPWLDGAMRYGRKSKTTEGPRSLQDGRSADAIEHCDCTSECPA